MIHEPFVTRIDGGPSVWPTYEITWPQGEPGPGDQVLMSADLFAQSIKILSGECPSCSARDTRPVIAYVYKAGELGENVFLPEDITLMFHE